jgi:parallel beta-helix repeat protein
MPESQKENDSGTESKTAGAITIQRLDMYRESFPGEKLSYDRATAIVKEIARRLDETGREKTPYLQIRPANIAVTQDGKVKLRKFGEEEEEEGKDSEGRVKLGGKHIDRTYMSPEELAKESVDQRADVWSLGAVFFELVTGELPFSGENSDAEIRQIIDESSSTWGLLTPRQNEVLYKALAKSKEDRYSTATEFAQALDSAKEKKMPRWKAVLIGASVVVVCAIASLLIILYVTSPDELHVPKQYPTIQKAIDEAKPGDTVRIEAGVYATRVKLKEGVRLVGEDMDKVTIRSEASKGPVLRAIDCSSGAISDLTIEHLSSMIEEYPNPALLLNESSVEVLRCKVRHASGDGIKIMGGGHSTIEKCTVRSNGGHGVVVAEGATATLRNNECSENGIIGICFMREAHGFAVENTCRHNSECGIGVFGSGTDPVIENNHCRANKIQGIYFGKSSNGVAQLNTCEENGKSGIAIANEGTAPTIRENRCRKNSTQGIIFFLGSGGVADGNVTEENGWSGIEANGEGTSPAIRKNQSSRNKEYGIAVVDGASAVAEENKCEENEKSGIGVKGAATATTIRDNKCLRNTGDGIVFSDLARGLAERNECRGNKQNGIAVAGRGTNPVLRDNICSENEAWGIFFDDDAEPEIGTGNVAEGNGAGQIKQ